MLPDLTTRVSLARYPELMDQPCTLADLRTCLRDISRVTALTSGYRPTMHWLNHVYSVMPVQPKPLHIVDVGCGYGDFLRLIYRWAKDKNLPVVLTGIDLNPDAVQIARAATIPGTVTYLAGNAHDFHPPQGIDIVISSLVMHHLENREIVDMLDWMESNAKLGWFISDLHRQKFSYNAFKLLTKFTAWHRFVKHDGPVSILRSFRDADWIALLKAAAIPEQNYILRHYSPARLCVARLKVEAKS